jgi:hypothetical protein
MAPICVCFVVSPQIVLQRQLEEVKRRRNASSGITQQMELGSFIRYIVSMKRRLLMWNGVLRQMRYDLYVTVWWY